VGCVSTEPLLLNCAPLQSRDKGEMHAVLGVGESPVTWVSRDGTSLLGGLEGREEGTERVYAVLRAELSAQGSHYLG
jgi:hypothetical protein